MKISKDGSFTASLGSLCPWLAVLRVKKLLLVTRLNFSHFTLCLLSCLLSCHHKALGRAWGCTSSALSVKGKETIPFSFDIYLPTCTTLCPLIWINISDFNFAYYICQKFKYNQTRAIVKNTFKHRIGVEVFVHVITSNFLWCALMMTTLQHSHYCPSSY